MSSSSAAAIGSYRLGFMGLGWALGLINASLTHAGFQIRVWPGTKCKLRARLRGVRQAIVDVCHKKGPSQVSNPSPQLRCSDQACQPQRLRACPTYRLGGGIRQKKKIQAAHAKEKQPI